MVSVGRRPLGETLPRIVGETAGTEREEVRLHIHCLAAAGLVSACAREIKDKLVLLAMAPSGSM